MKNLSLINALALGIFLLSCPAYGGEPLYESHFEDEIHGIIGWNWQNASGEMTVEIREVKIPGETGPQAVLSIVTPAREAPFRIAQSGGLFSLQPGQSYELRAKMRVSDLHLGTQGKVRIFVTDSRWTWSSKPISLTAIDPDWSEFSTTFTVPEALNEQYFRVRIEITDAVSDWEIAEIAVIPLD